MDPVVVQHVGRAVDRDGYLCQVGVEIFFRFSGAGCVRLDEEEKDAFQRPSLGVDPQVNPRVRCFRDPHDLFSLNMVVQELLPRVVDAVRIVRQGLASHHFVLKLDVFQFVFQLGRVRPSDHLGSRGKGQLEQKVVVKSLGVEHAVIREDLALQPDLVTFLENRFQPFFRGYPRGRFVARIRPDLGKIHALDALLYHVVPVLFRNEKVLKDFENVVTDVLQSRSGELHNHPVNQSPRNVLHEVVVGVAAHQVDIENQGKRAGMRTSFSFSFGTETYSVSPGFASVRSNVMRKPAIATAPTATRVLFTSCDAFPDEPVGRGSLGSSFFSACFGCDFGFCAVTDSLFAMGLCPIPRRETEALWIGLEGWLFGAFPSSEGPTFFVP